MKKLLVIALTSTAALTLTALVSTANAAQGCGAGYHRGPYGHCRPNVATGGTVVVVPPGGPRVGVYYHGRGYWDGRRYWVHRERWHGGWRYY
ncbi:hypothetical protein QA648_20900 (plasmid) [Rhizobium sp. CB3171]|uniref:GCG_CRPN prefix-to-repeats domain-containing protein n=1 Tax=unclassified Rhizobium TaxID=2613769 RepID=UPI000CF1CF4C|nr:MULTISPECIES: hypothetical protein [unclassified Rhizobium]UWU24664.1 hypothetical protein N2601_21180 [Rhizobium tropici]WFU05639.1 hypothetical protein QA648_20900 [Rhizobium sp. CB3171]